MIHAREHGRFLTHYGSNSTLLPPLRSFTCNTIPFTVPDYKQPREMPRLMLHEILANSFLMFKHPFEVSGTYAQGMVEDEMSKEKLVMSGENSHKVVKELQMEGLAKFIAYGNRAIKVVFEDRTIVRLREGC